MKAFFSKYSYNMFKCFLNQFAISMFGLVLAIACGGIDSAPLTIISSLGSIAFYLFLLYISMWDTGAKDKPAVDGGRAPKRPFTGALIALCANAPTFLFSIFIMLGMLIPGGLGGFGGLVVFVSHFLNGMYTGLMTVNLFGAPLNSYFVTWLLLPLPAIITCTLAYIAGLNDRHLTHFLIPDTPEEAEIKKAKKEARKK